VVQSEKFFKNPAEITSRVYDYLSLNKDIVNITEITGTTYNAAPSKPGDGIDKDLESELSAFFAPYNQLLKQMLGDDLDLTLWKMPEIEKEELIKE